MIRYFLTIRDRDTDQIVYENGFYTDRGVNEELEDWDLEQHCYEIEAVIEEAAQ